MADIGQHNTLKVVRHTEHGVYLDGDKQGDILLPRRYVPEGIEKGDEVDVFVYLDSDDLIVATTDTPKAKVGECAYLKVAEVNRVGAFMDWGLPKDLLVPFSEQVKPMEAERSYVVTLFLDKYTKRIAASAKLSHFLSEQNDGFEVDQAVDLLIWGKTDLGYKAVINGTHLGLLFAGDVFRKLSYGQKLKGYIKLIRPDGKINLTLQLANQESRDSLSQQILDHLQALGGESAVTDKSPPDVINKQFGVSKKNFKRALGGLYKQRLIVIEKDRIKLL